AQFLTGVWVGNDDNSPTKKVTGGSIPAAIWVDIMGPLHASLPAEPLPGDYRPAYGPGIGGPIARTAPYYGGGGGPGGRGRGPGGGLLRGSGDPVGRPRRRGAAGRADLPRQRDVWRRPLSAERSPAPRAPAPAPRDDGPARLREAVGSSE